MVGNELAQGVDGGVLLAVRPLLVGKQDHRAACGLGVRVVLMTACRAGEVVGLVEGAPAVSWRLFSIPR